MDDTGAAEDRAQGQARPEVREPAIAPEPSTAREPELAQEPQLAQEPRLASLPPAGLPPSTGLPPSPGILPPTLTPPPAIAAPGSTTPMPEGTASVAPPAPQAIASTPAAQAATAPPAASLPHGAPVPGSVPAGSVPAPPAPVPPAERSRIPGAGSTPPATASPAPPRHRPQPDALRTGKRIGAWVVGAVVVGLGLTGAVGFLRSAADGLGQPPGPEERNAYAESEEFAGSAQAVEDFLVALAEGDAETARELTGRDGSEPLLSAAALDEAIRAAPITAIEVEPGEASDGAYDAEVAAAYEVGGERIERTFQLWHWSDGWVLVDATEYLALSAYSGLGLTLGGVAAESDGAYAYPIAYPAALESPWFDLAAAEDGVVVLADADAARALDNPEWTLNSDGVREFRARVSDSLERCAGMATLDTPCGMSVQEEFEDGWVPLDGSVVRTLEPEALAELGALEPVTSYDPITRMTAYVRFSAKVSLDVELDGEVRSGELAYPETSLQPFVDFADPDLPVTWE
ncbi:hypothetical protein D3248_09675 [Leucobacter zeae]|nr:hypothetical protein [Leucobacter zeae]